MAGAKHRPPPQQIIPCAPALGGVPPGDGLLPCTGETRLDRTRRGPVAHQEGSTSVPSPAAATITLGADGRVYFHDLTPELLPVAAAISPQALSVARRELLATMISRISP